MCPGIGRPTHIVSYSVMAGEMKLLLQGSVLLVLTLYLVSCMKPLHQYTKLRAGKDLLLPKSFAECVDVFLHPSFPKHVVQAIQNHCLDGFISIDHTHNWAANFTIDEQNYIRSIFRKVINDAAELNNIHSRHKRDVGLFPPRVRREVRDPEYQPWYNYARNVRRLKFETITPTGRSKYDIIADIHGTAIQSAHFGPNFLPWHRLYLIILESALGAPIPYWESPIDFAMNDPTQSILWTERYFGNGFGFTKTGPFANFETPIGKLFRNVGSDGSLMNRRDVSKIFKQSRLAQISEPTAVEEVSLEGQHNGVHIWVDGQMNNLEVSPHDPIFFCHHSFVDYVWDIFRSLQKKRGVDPTIDTVAPPESVTLQNVTDPAVGLTGYYNSDGYSKMIAAMVKYKPSALCPLCLNSPAMYCDKSKNVCVSRRRHPDEYSGRREEARRAAMDSEMMNGGSNANPFELYVRDERVRMDSVTMNYNEPMNNDGGSANNGVEMNNALLMNRIDKILGSGRVSSVNSRMWNPSNAYENVFVIDQRGAMKNGKAMNKEELSRNGIHIENLGPVNNYKSVSDNIFFDTQVVPMNNRIFPSNNAPSSNIIIMDGGVEGIINNRDFRTFRHTY